MATFDRDLTLEQHRRLELIDQRYPEAKVVGWHKKDSDGRYGPVVKFSGLVFKFINHTGRMINGR